MEEAHCTLINKDKQMEPAKAEVNGDVTIYEKNAQTFVPVSLKLH